MKQTLQEQSYKVCFLLKSLVSQEILAIKFIVSEAKKRLIKIAADYTGPFAQ